MPIPPQFSTEERISAKARTDATRRMNSARLRSDFADEEYWMDLARAIGVRLPHYGVPVTRGRMQKWLRILGMSRDEYVAWAGLGVDGNSTTLTQEAARYDSQGWPLRAWVGLVLEQLERRGRIHSDPEEDAAPESPGLSRG